MAISLRHAFVSAKTDGPDVTVVQPSNWNENHELTQASGRLLGRTDAGDGPTQEIAVAGGLSMASGVLSGAAFAQKSANLSDLENVAQARDNLGLTIGEDVQGFSPTLQALANAGGSGAGLVPAGAVMAMARTTAPTGWLVCNGALVSRSAFAALFAAIGTAFGAGDGSTTFALPDLRGEFIRGFDGGRGVDADRVFGSAQGDAIRNITGRMTVPSRSFDGTSYFFGFAGAYSGFQSGALGTSDSIQSSSNDWAYTELNFDASRVVPVAGENRPRNVALLICIKT